MLWTDNMDLEEVWSRNASLPEAAVSPVQDIISETARKRPSKAAICAWDGDFTYEQLLTISSGIADQILNHGGSPSMVIPICMKKSKWMPVALLGALRAGCGIALVDSTTSPERLNHIIQALSPPFLLTSSDMSSAMEKIIPSIAVDKLDLRGDAGFYSTVPPKKHPSAAVAVVFTSGSTGSPKGVILGSECISTTAVHGAKLFRLDETSRVFQFASYSFDISLHETLMTLVAGGCLCIPSEQQKVNDTSSAIQKFGANWVCLTPSAASIALNDVEDAFLRTIVLTGEPITAQVSKLPHAENLFGWYGSTEVPLACVSTVDEKTWQLSRIGFGSPGLCWVVNSENHETLCAKGEVGELLVEGPMQTMGYLNCPERTAAAFVNNPAWLARGSSRVPGRSGRLFKTGDLVTYDKDGFLSYISRKDTMVKIRGQRLELGEVENQIYKLIRTGVVRCRESNVSVVAETTTKDTNNDVELVVFICFGKAIENGQNMTKGLAGQHTTAEDVQPLPFAISNADDTFHNIRSIIDQELKQALPAYMRPSMYFDVNMIPMTQTGKTDRRLLRTTVQSLPIQRLMAARATDVKNHTIPRGKMENSLCDLWARVLKIDRSLISTNLDFLECGGDSLKAMTLVKALEKEFHISVKVSQLIGRDMNIKNLTSLIKDAQSGKLQDERTVDIAMEIERWTTELEKMPAVTHRGTSYPATRSLQVLLTGATGYLGSQILRHLIKDTRVGKVIALVRAHSVEHAVERIRSVASMSGWWKKSILRKVDVWIGDLAKPKLGLRAEDWGQISRINIIIHNGAVVSWDADYTALESVNVKSTFQLLQASLQSCHLHRLIYISGGLKQEHNQSDSDHINNLNNTSGYDQTKYVSEQLTLAAERLHQQGKGVVTPPHSTSDIAHRDWAFQVVKPGYVIGDRHKGLTNVDDFLWRLVAGAARMRAFPQDPPDFWLDLIEVTHVARHVVQQSCVGAIHLSKSTVSPPASDSDHEDGKANLLGGSSHSAGLSIVSSPAACCDHTMQVDDLARGLPVSSFWNAIQQQLGILMESYDWDTWIRKAHEDMERETESHPLWGIQQFLGPTLGHPRMVRSPTTFDKVDCQIHTDATSVLDVQDAVRRCVKYLIDIKFITQLPQADEDECKASEDAEDPEKAEAAIQHRGYKRRLNQSGPPQERWLKRSRFVHS